MRAYSEWARSRADERQLAAEAMASAVRGLLALPASRHALELLDKGVGTATEQACWTEVRTALRRYEEAAK